MAEDGREIPCAQQAEDGLLSRPEFRLKLPPVATDHEA